jgi:hypothetical protein
MTPPEGAPRQGLYHEDAWSMVVASSSMEVADRLVVADLMIPHLVMSTSWGGAAAGENRAPTPVMTDNGGVYTLLPC